MKKQIISLFGFLSLALLVSCGQQTVSSDVASSESLAPSSDSLVSSADSSIAQSDSSSESVSSEPTLKTFTGITFPDGTFVYDGAYKSIEVVGLPDFAEAHYQGNGQKDVGEYAVTARVTAEGYQTLDLSADLVITPAAFEGISFEGASFDYDGETHGIYVTGAPDFATVSYKNNDQRDVGSYTVKATVSDPNYETLTLTATLKIVGKAIEGVTFPDATFTYDGEAHFAEVEGEIPAGVSVSYKDNSRTESGSQKARATLSGPGYEKLELSATLKIVPAPLERPGYLYDATYIYDGSSHSIEVEYAPDYATISYRCLNASGTNSFTKPGFYIVEATVKEDANNASTLTAHLAIVEKGTIGTDADKSALTIDDNLTWDALHEALGQDNYTMDSYSGYYDAEEMDGPIPEGLLTKGYEHQTVATFATDGKEAYREASADDYDFYDYYKEVGDDVAHLSFDTDLHSSSLYLFPKAAFSETVCKEGASNAFVALKKGEDGGFLQGVDGDDYYSDVGTPFIEDGCFTVLMKHPRTLDGGYRYFYEVYRFYNIGNTKVTVPSACAPAPNYLASEALVDDYVLDGVEYGTSTFGSYPNFKTYYTAELYVSCRRAVFQKPGTYTVLPEIYGHAVEAIVFTASYYAYNLEQDGYCFNLYVDEDGVYQGDYADYGELLRFDISEISARGGTVNYYGEW
ncbi:MAG: MBG domain-containing protein [Bacilli bacterium]|nr:MBG domain-containing protein [Bacilli bacterium]